MEQQNYRQARKDAGLKPEKAASDLGVSVSTLFSWERGETNPDADKVRDMAKLYGVSPDFLLGL